MFLRKPSHWAIVILVLVLLFGWKRLPDMARSVGRSMRIFNTEPQGMKTGDNDTPPSAPADDVVAGDVVPPRTTDDRPAG